MKTKLILVITSLLLFPFLLFSQKITLRGALVDSAAAPLEGGTVMLLNARDSSLLAFTRSQTAGAFEFKNQSPGDYLLRASYPGFRTRQQAIRLDAATPLLDLGPLAMDNGLNLIDGVEISAAANPVALRGDTVEYNAASFKTRPNAVVEDLLRKLPGIEVEADGTIKAMGQTVQQIMVDGKKFFSNDPTLATKNLPADAVNKVQVFDKKSDQAEFSGVDDGQRQKTINLDLREDRKDGWFGQLTAGAGAGADAARYESRASLNRFSPKQQLSFLGLGNNINQAGFSIDDYMAYSGAMRQMMSGGGRIRLQFDSDNMSVPLDFGNNEGFLDTWAGGVNFNQDYGPKRRAGSLNASYMYSRARQRYDRSTERTTFLPNGDFTTMGQSGDENLRENHRINLSFDQKIDSFNSVLFNSAFAYGDNAAQNASRTQTFGPDGRPQNAGDRIYQSDATGANWTGNLLWRHKFAKKGRNVSLNFDAGLNRSESASSSFADNQFYNDGQLLRRDTTAQDQTFRNDVLNFGARATYTEPLGKRRYLEFSYAFALTDNQADKDVYDVAGGENSFNALLSNAYENQFSYHRAGAGFRINRKKWNGSAGFDYQSAVLDGAVTSGQGQPVRQSFRHALPRLDLNYEFGPTRNLGLNYQTRVTAPTVQQLQPVPDVSDPLNIVEGNPTLQPEYAHSLQANFNTFNPDNLSSFFTNLSLDYTADRIVNAQRIDSQFVRYFRPVNTPGEYRLFGMAAWGWPVRKWKSRLNLRSEGQWNRGQGLVNERTNVTTNLSLTEAVSWEYTPAEGYVFSAGAELIWNQSLYSIDDAYDQEFLTQRYSAEADLQLPKDFAFNTSFNVAVNTGRADGFNTAIPIWNAELSRFFGKNKRFQAGLSVRDLLDRNLGLHRTANLNYVEDERVASLGRTVMVRAVYSLNRMGGPGGGGPRMRMMIRR